MSRVVIFYLQIPQLINNLKSTAKDHKISIMWILISLDRDSMSQLNSLTGTRNLADFL